MKSTPGRVSSKSLMSNATRPSGLTKTPKLPIWQSPQAWTGKPAMADPARSAAMIAAAPRRKVKAFLRIFL
ncbi:hypothetical protein OCOJLMKI_4503 [Methylobacterium iners]|uniref:Uncharacterized protein n=1 Tax=Methylobacterium iners TaxID=418707 RepID=A0ABQ4S6H1_9HYPH|nr:hypothetical protein OCOJLMKI_4503 [Methylobacterium iners]